MTDSIASENAKMKFQFICEFFFTAFDPFKGAPTKNLKKAQLSFQNIINQQLFLG